MIKKNITQTFSEKHFTHLWDLKLLEFFLGYEQPFIRLKLNNTLK